MEEQGIIRLIREKNEQGAALLLRHYAPLMRYIIAPILANEQDREECLSEAFMRVWEKIDTYDPQRGGWSAWLTAVTRNAARNRARQKRSGSDTEELTHTLASERTIAGGSRSAAGTQCRAAKSHRAAFPTGQNALLSKVLLSAVNRTDCL